MSLTSELSDVLGAGDAISDAVDSVVDRASTAIDVTNQNTDTAKKDLEKGKDSAIAAIDDGLNAARDELIKGGNIAQDTLISTTKDGIIQLNKGRESITSRAGQSMKILEMGYTNGIDALRTSHQMASSNIREFLAKSIDAITQGTDAATSQLRGTLKQVRKNLSGFIKPGETALNRAEQLTNDPNQQLAFIKDNPFYNALADDAQERLLQNQASSGRIGSGDTVKTLQDKLVLLGADLVNQNIGQNLGIADRGLNAAINLNSAEQNIGGSIADLLFGSGQLKAGLNERAGSALSNINMNLGRSEAGLNESFANSGANLIFNTGVQEAGASNNVARMLEGLGVNLSNLQSGLSTNLANLETGAANTRAGMEFATGQGNANLTQNNTSFVTQLLSLIGQTEGQGKIADYNAGMDGLNMIIDIAAMAMGAPPPSATGGGGGGSKPVVNMSALENLGNTVPDGVGFSLPGVN